MRKPGCFSKLKVNLLQCERGIVLCQGETWQICPAAECWDAFSIIPASRYSPGHVWDPCCYQCWATDGCETEGFVLHWSQLWFCPTHIFAILGKYLLSWIELCSKLILDSHQRFSCEILYLILCSDQSKIFFFGSEHLLELMTAITFLTFSWPIFT